MQRDLERGSLLEQAMAGCVQREGCQVVILNQQTLVLLQYQQKL